MKKIMRKLNEVILNIKMVSDHGDKAIVVEVGLAVIAVVLLVVFKEGIQGMVENVIGVMEENITNIFDEI